MRSLAIFIILSLHSTYGLSQTINDSINKDDAAAILQYLASDKLKGRVNFTKEQLQAAEFISKKFTDYSLEPFPGYTNYYFPFSTHSSNTVSKEKLIWNGKNIADSSFVFISHSLSHEPMQLEDFTIIQTEIPLYDSLLYQHWLDSLNIIIQINLPANTNLLSVTKNILVPPGFPVSDILIIASPDKPVSLKFSENKNFTNSVLYNVIGVLPGKTKPGEAIIFSAHYDHIDKNPEGRGGGIFNGANDNASGTTAVILLARYFSLRKNNERTIIFCLFAGEEIGLLGSKAFAGELLPESIKAVINIEMIGLSNSIGENSFFITGADHSDLYQILKKNLSSKKVAIKQDPSPGKQLFERSDNYTFALKGIPAHSIMCSDDSDPCYHQNCDDFKNINIENMTRIIQAIAKSCKTLISGEDTPLRIK